MILRKTNFRCGVTWSWRGFWLFCFALLFFTEEQFQEWCDMVMAWFWLFCFAVLLLLFCFVCCFHRRPVSGIVWHGHDVLLLFYRRPVSEVVWHGHDVLLLCYRSVTERASAAAASSVRKRWTDDDDVGLNVLGDGCVRKSTKVGGSVKLVCASECPL